MPPQRSLYFCWGVAEGEQVTMEVPFKHLKEELPQQEWMTPRGDIRALEVRQRPQLLLVVPDNPWPDLLH